VLLIIKHIRRTTTLLAVF